MSIVTLFLVLQSVEDTKVNGLIMNPSESVETALEDEYPKPETCRYTQ